MILEFFVPNICLEPADCGPWVATDHTAEFDSLALLDSLVSHALAELRGNTAIWHGRHGKAGRRFALASNIFQPNGILSSVRIFQFDQV